MTRAFDIPEPRPVADQSGDTFPRLVELMQRLLATDGCPWDREQDFRSLRRYILEEACEVIDAIDAEDSKELCEEIGDLTLQVVFMCELGRREGTFGPDDAIRAIIEKLVRRHPHVFGETQVANAEEVLKNWEAIKSQEKADRRLLDGVPRSLPALLRAQRMGDKTRRVGFDWPDGRGARDKVTEEIAELDLAIASGTKEQIEHELGDSLFALVNLARHHGIDAEMALRGTADRFADRFAHVEDRVRDVHGGWPSGQDGKPLSGVPLAELDGYWNEAKARA
jgi:tetrapyrrole methylase family protein/MazG family protein/ATP diphosphatase